MKPREQLGGIYAASITAYDAGGRVDAAALQAVMERNLREGAAGQQRRVLPFDGSRAHPGL